MKDFLLIIDAQFDFCNQQGSLYVPNAENDCKNIADFIMKNDLDQIFATLDTHYPYHIAHPLFWKTAEGKHPNPYTIITYKDVKEGKYRPSDSEQKEYVLYYLNELERKGKYQLCIWPPHCIKGSNGRSVDKTVYNALTAWQEKNIGKTVKFIEKAETPFTEQYSAIEAEVPIENEEKTKTNFAFINSLNEADRIFIAGEALSHCVANTTRDLIKHIPAQKFVLLRNCTSNVAGFEKLGEAFVKEFIEAGGTCM